MADEKNVKIPKQGQELQAYTRLTDQVTRIADSPTMRMIRAIEKDQSWRKMFDDINRHDRAFSSLAQTMKVLEANTTVRSLVDQIEQHKLSMRIAEGPIAELRKSGLFGAASINTSLFSETQRQMDAFAKQFQLPEFDRVTQMVAEFQRGPVGRHLARFIRRAD